MPSLLGFWVQKQFNQAWFCIHIKLDENILMRNLSERLSLNYNTTIRLQQDRLETLGFNQIYITEQNVTNTFDLEPDSQYSFTFDSKNELQSFIIVTLKCS